MKLPKFSEEFLAELQRRADAVQIVGEYVELEQSGRNFKGKCPFHQDKTPSFYVYPTDNNFHCFGCGAHGDLINFFERQKNLGFQEAVRELANRVGLELPKTSRSANFNATERRRQKVSKALEVTSKFFQRSLERHPDAQQYLHDRGLSSATIQQFELGFAPARYRAASLASDDITTEDLVHSGILIHRDEQKLYERFRNRIMFPIRDVKGQTIAFGGRTLVTEQKNQPKYLNSPELPTFKKGSVLYGMYEARSNKLRLDNLLLVEGYMDVVMLWQHGVKNAVAPLGTALTEAQIELMKRVVKEVIICFDGDEAGEIATWRAVQRFYSVLERGQSIRIVRLPDQHDPDSYIRKHGVEAFHTCINDATPSSQYVFDALQKGKDLEVPEQTAQFIEQCMEMIQLIPYDVYAASMHKKLATLAHIDQDQLPQLRPVERRRSVGARRTEFTRGERSSHPPVTNNKLSIGESNILQYLVHDLKFVPLITKQTMETIIELRKESMLFDILIRIRKNDLHSITELLASYPPDSEESQVLEKLAKRTRISLSGSATYPAVLNAIELMCDKHKEARRIRQESKDN